MYFIYTMTIKLMGINKYSKLNEPSYTSFKKHKRIPQNTSYIMKFIMNIHKINLNKPKYT